MDIFLQARWTGQAAFLDRARDNADWLGRMRYCELLGEAVPQAMLAEFGLSPALLGYSGGGESLLQIPEEFRERAVAYLRAAGEQVAAGSQHELRLAIASTENLGAWTDSRQRLAAELRTRAGILIPAPGADFFAPSAPAEQGSYRHFVRAQTARWTADGLTVDSETEGVSVRAGQGWGVLRTRVDGSELRLHRTETIDEQLRVTASLQNFFRGELERIGGQPGVWRHAAVLASGYDGCVIYGAWEALLTVARELQRVFQLFSTELLREQPGPEGKTLSAGLALVNTPQPIARVAAQADEQLRLAQAEGKDVCALFGRVLDWKQFAAAGELKDRLIQLVREYGAPVTLLDELAGLYQDTPGVSARKGDRFDRPWRLSHRLQQHPGGRKLQEQQRLRGRVLTELLGRSASQPRLRPAGRVALEWARLEQANR